MDGKQRAIKALPDDHQLGMRVPKGGSSCAKCEYLSSPTTCGNKGFVEWNGGEKKLPEPADEYCCDLYDFDKKLTKSPTSSQKTMNKALIGVLSKPVER